MSFICKNLGMKYCLLLIGIIVTYSASAQFNFKFYTQAGANYSDVRISRTTGVETTKDGFGWQGGIGTEYHTSFGYFVYIGANIRKESYRKDSISAFFPDTVSQVKYTPLFLSIPIGIGWEFPVEKNISLKAYGGLNIQVGVAGKANRHDLYYQRDSATAKPVLLRTETSEHDLKFGRNSRKKYAYDYANSNWGIQVGTGIMFCNSFELDVFYHHGFTNILPNKDAAVEINKLSFFEVNARLYLPNQYWSDKKKKR